MNKIPIVLLAAGSSSRMGQPKQLLPWGKTTLIEYQAEKLLHAGNPLFVVLGSSSEQIISIIQKYAVEIVINSSWEQGMGTSVATGMHKVLEVFPLAKGVLFVLIDQPLVTLYHLQKLIMAFNSGNEQIIASKSENGWLGVPALFDACYFDELKPLSGNQGAKTIIKNYPSKVISIDAGDMLKDMDTPHAYELFLKKAFK